MPAWIMAARFSAERPATSARVSPCPTERTAGSTPSPAGSWPKSPPDHPPPAPRGAHGAPPAARGERRHPPATLDPELHLARLEAALAPLDEHELAAPAVDHRAL